MRGLDRTVRLLEEGIERGLHPGAQLYVSLAGEVVADLAVGEARRGVAMTPETLTLWLSSTKPTAAVALARLWERRELELDDPVVRVTYDTSRDAAPEYPWHLERTRSGLPAA